LAGLIQRCGLVQADNETELKERVEHAYDEYKLDVARRATATGRALLLGWLLGGSKKAYALDHLEFGFDQKFPKIAFIGVWDTVDAYGMPVDELKLGIDKFIWPMTLADRKLSKHITRVCHALSLDDDRPTFRPVLWDETGVSSDQLSQIWFGGVHANVGGGYPDDGLAYVTLQWILGEAKAQGLWFYDQAQIAVDSAADQHGKQYDARSGIAGYYRYGPRVVDQLCRDADHDVKIETPRVHRAALGRIVKRQAAYAPVSFPTGYVVMDHTSNPYSLEESEKPESDSGCKERSEDMELAWDAVVRRRIAYLSAVTLTLLLILLPLGPVIASGFNWLSGKAPPQGWLTSGLDAVGTVAGWPFWLAGAVGDFIWRLFESIPGVGDIVHGLAAVTLGVLTLAKGMLWSWTRLWFDWYEQHPIFFLIAALLLAWVFVYKSAQLQNEVFARADYAWRKLRGNPPPSPPPPTGGSPSPSPHKPTLTVNDRVVRALRKNKLLQAIYRLVSLRIVPFLFAIMVAVVGLPIAVLFLPKFIRQLARKRRYRTTGGPTDTTPAPRIPRSPMNIQPDTLAKELPAEPALKKDTVGQPAEAAEAARPVVRELEPA
jgi:hypothetical protein